MAELIAANFEIIKAFATTDWIDKNNQHSALVTEVTVSELERISALKTPNEVFVIAKQKVLKGEPSINGNLTLVLDGLQDPGNMGTIIRIADWFGITQIVASENSVEIYNPKVVQATMGSICRVNVWYKDIEAWISGLRVPVYGALLNGEGIYETNKVTEGVLVIGNESKGISGEILKLITHPITIPKIGGAESLNAAVAAGIILSHMKK